VHELGITQSILDIAAKHAAKANATRVTDIYIKIGRLSSFIDDSIQFYWDILSQDSICQQAKIHFERIPAKLVCLDCANSYTLDGELEPCPKCKSIRVKVTSGGEFMVDSIEVE
jgi:hydrogenase nickel incorporation protein HypA/HybF